MHNDHDRFQRLFALAAEIKAAAPWEFMDEDDNFAVVLPEPHEVGLVSVMGARGEHFAVAVYLGYRAIVEFWALLADQDGDEPAAVLEINHLQLSWENRSLLEDRDRHVLADVGIRPRGANAWPMLRRYRPGYFPWFADVADIEIMTTVLEQLSVMMPRIRANVLQLAAPQGQFLLRYPASTAPAVPNDWSERLSTVPLHESDTIAVEVDGARMSAFETLRVSPIEVELDLFAAPTLGIDGRKEGVGQPYYPYLLMAVDRRTGMVLGFQTLTALQGLERMWTEIPRAFVDLLIRGGFRPAKILVHRPLLSTLLSGLCAQGEIELQLVPKLKALAAARRSLEAMPSR